VPWRRGWRLRSSDAGRCRASDAYDTQCQRSVTRRLMSIVGGFDVYRKQITFDYLGGYEWEWLLCVGRSPQRHGRDAVTASPSSFPDARRPTIPHVQDPRTGSTGDGNDARSEAAVWREIRWRPRPGSAHSLSDCALTNSAKPRRLTITSTPTQLHHVSRDVHCRHRVLVAGGVAGMGPPVPLPAHLSETLVKVRRQASGKDENLRFAGHSRPSVRDM
jgi:hypothetical protein